MAAINPTIVREVGTGDGSVVRVTWTPITSADTCTAIALPEYTEKSIQALGTFGSGNVAVHGSNDAGVTFAALNDPAGTVIDITAAGIKKILEPTEYIKPVVTTGDGTQSLTLVVLAVRMNSLRT